MSVRRVQIDPHRFYKSIHSRFAVLSLAAFAVIGLVTWSIVHKSQHDIRIYQAQEIAEILARQAASMRSVYAKEVLEKLRGDGTGGHIHYVEKPGYVPLPAQFLKLVSSKTQNALDGLAKFRPISRWNLEPAQGLEDDFQQWAWQQLEQQDQRDPTGPIEWQSVSRTELVDGDMTLRFMRADPATSESCVQCHNRLERSESIRGRRFKQNNPDIKQWKQHQLMGALEVSIPLKRIESLPSEKVNDSLAKILVVVGLSLFLLGVLTYLNIRRIFGFTRRLQWQAEHDDLTGLLNRASFEQYLGNVLDTSSGNLEHHSLLFLDLDRFKIVNDTCGHHAGDELLKQFSECVKNVVRNGDVVARMGGDEFAILLKNANVRNAKSIAGKIKSEVNDLQFVSNGQAFRIGVSIGLIPVGNQEASVETLLRAVDVACYAAKDTGRDRVHVIDKIDDESVSDHTSLLKWATTLETALNANEFRLAVQIAESLVENDTTIYQEVLLRLIDKDGSYLPTTELIASAERYDMTQQIDRWVVLNTLANIRAGHLRCDSKSIVAINLSGASVRAPEFHEFLLNTLDATDQSVCASLCFEVTETATIGNISDARRLITELSARGCSVALDDFGAGLSSFNYLKNLSVDFIKIDGNFVRDLDADSLNLAIVEAVVRFGSVIKIPVIAECVETQEAKSIVADLGISYAQGFGIHRPQLLPAMSPGNESPNSESFRMTVAQTFATSAN